MCWKASLGSLRLRSATVISFASLNKPSDLDFVSFVVLILH